MPEALIDIASLCLDEFGRVILSDDMLDAIAEGETYAGGGLNYNCSGSSNGGCTNGVCDHTGNSWCTNSGSCFGGSNGICKEPSETDPDV